MAATPDTLRKRATILRCIRRFFHDHDFLEVETPYLVSSPGMEPYLEAFQTVFTPEIGQKVIPLFLPTSPEFHMKRLLCLGCNRIFQIARAFRNGETGDTHNPEFTILEWYRSHAGYTKIMTDIEHLISITARDLHQTTTISWKGHRIELEPPWERLTVKEAWLRFTGIDLDAIQTPEAFRSAGQAMNIPHLLPEDSWEVIYFKIFLHCIEPYLGIHQPVILYEYPSTMAALARLKPSNPTVALRFEVYIGGLELANAFDELTNPLIQRERFMESQRDKTAMGKEPFPVDEKFLTALENGMPPSAGIAMGVDRLVMILLDQHQITNVLAFPFVDEFLAPSSQNEICR